MSPATTPSQTIGPFFGFGLPWPEGPHVVPAGTPGAVRIAGRLLDGAGEPVADGLIETWQADPDGRFDHPDDPRGASAREGFRGFGRCPTGEDGSWWILTLKPGSVPGPDGRPQAPHVDVSVFARGLLIRLVTRIYFADEAEANAADPVLAGLGSGAEGASLLGHPDGEGYRFDIRLQGDDETVFFDL